MTDPMTPFAQARYDAANRLRGYVLAQRPRTAHQKAVAEGIRAAANLLAGDADRDRRKAAKTCGADEFWGDK